MTKAADAMFKPDGYKVRMIYGVWFVLFFAGNQQVDSEPFPSYNAAEAHGKASGLPDIERAATGDRP